MNRDSIKSPWLALAGVFLLVPWSASFGQRASGKADGSGGGLLDRWQIHPTYNTSYSVNRTRTRWDQGLSFRRDLIDPGKAGEPGALAVRLNNRTKLSLTDNSAQNDFKERRGSNSLKLDADWRAWTLGLDFDIRRDRSDNNFSRRKDSDTNLGLRIERELAVPFISPVQLSTTAGLSTESDLSERRGRTARTDSSNASGTTWDLGISSSGPIIVEAAEDGSEEGHAVFSYSGSAGMSGANQTNETFSFEDGELAERQRDPNDDIRRDGQLRFTWDPKSEWRGEVSGRLLFTRTEAFDFEVEQKETRTGVSQNLDLSVEGPLREGLTLEAAISRAVSDINYDVKAQDNFKQTDEVASTLSYEPDWFLLKGFALRGDVEFRNTRREPETTRRFNDVEERKARFVTERDLAPGLRATGTTEVYLRQEIFDDGSLDKDELRTLFDGSLSYSPNQAFSARVSFLRSETELVNIRAEEAANNNTVQRNRVSARYEYDFSFPVQVRQTFNISADYTFFDYDEGSNTLRRTNEVKTEIEAGFGKASKVIIDHQYRFGDSGVFRQPEAGGNYLYSPTSETVRQYLTLETEYKIGRVVTLRASQSFDGRTTTTLSTGRSRTTERVEFSGSVNFKHKFSPSFSVEGDFRQTQSNQEDDFWVVEASMNRAF